MKSLSTKFSVLRIRKDLRVTRSKCEIRGTRDSGTQLWGTVPVTENFPGHGPVPTPDPECMIRAAYFVISEIKKNKFDRFRDL